MAGLVASQERHRQSQKEGDHRDERNRADAGAIALPEKTGSAKRDTPAPDVVQRFAKGVHDEPEQAADFVQEPPAHRADALQDEDGIRLDRTAAL